jgi:hypothetical protein
LKYRTPAFTLMSLPAAPGLQTGTANSVRAPGKTVFCR